MFFDGPINCIRWRLIMNYVDFEKLIKRSQSSCPCCEELSSTVISLPQYPLTEFYKEDSDDRKPFGFIDQEVLFCKSCNHLFLEKILDANKIYSQDNYLTSSISSKGAVDCINDFIAFIKSTSSVSGKTLIDIGGNDSTLLKSFLGKANHLINIDPNASTDNSNIEIREEFLEEVDFDCFKNSIEKIFISSHTIEHLENPADLLRSLSKVVNNKDIIYLQFPSMEKLFEQKRYDQICHQHIKYFSLKSLSILMESEGLYVQAYEYDTSHFGTLRVKITRNAVSQISHDSLSESDITHSYFIFQKYYKYLNESIYDVYKHGQGFGAGLMVPTLAYNLPIVDHLPVIIDENPSRIGKKFINLHPSIKSIDTLDVEKPVLITSISTKAAARAIFSKLTNLGVKDICIPSSII